MLVLRSPESFVFFHIWPNFQVWNLASEKPADDVASIPTTGAVEHIEVSGTTIMWSVDEPISPELPDNTVGMVYLLNSTDMSTVAIKVNTGLECVMLSLRCNVSSHGVRCSLCGGLRGGPKLNVSFSPFSFHSVRRNSHTRTPSAKSAALRSLCWMA